jgi:hypothetical protein
MPYSLVVNIKDFYTLAKWGSLVSSLIPLLPLSHSVDETS